MGLSNSVTMQAGHVKQVHVTSASTVDDAVRACGVNVGQKPKAGLASSSSRSPAVALSSAQQLQPSPQAPSPAAKRPRNDSGGRGGVPTSPAASGTSVSASTRAAVQSFVTRMTQRFKKAPPPAGCQERTSKTFKKLALDETSSEAIVVIEGYGPGKELRKAICRHHAMCMQHRCALMLLRCLLGSRCVRSMVGSVVMSFDIPAPEHPEGHGRE